VLLISMGATLDEQIYLAAYWDAQSVISSAGASSLILDLSRVATFSLSYSFLIEIGEMKPAVPPPGYRFVVAPRDAQYGAVRIVETLRSATQAPIKLVRQIDEAFEPLGVQASDFRVIQPT